jgi:hypothetical protein
MTDVIQTHGSSGSSSAPVDVHRNSVGHGAAVLCWVVCALLLADVLHRGRWPSNAIAALGLGLAAIFAYAVYWRPEVVADDLGVLLRNPLRDVRVPWSRVTSIGGSWSLAIRTERGSFNAFAAAPRRRPRRSRRGEIPEAAPPVLAQTLTDRWEHATASGGGQVGGGVAVRWAWEVLVPGLVLAVALVLIAVLA